MSSRVPLTRGLYAIVDDADAGWLSQWSWHAVPARRGHYAARKGHGNVKPIYMHREIASAPAGLVIDHANSNGLDNRRANLRICTVWQNNANAKRPASASGLRGVELDHATKMWRARIKCNGKRHELGRFDTAEEAARAYDMAAIHIHGRFAILNYPDFEAA